MKLYLDMDGTLVDFVSQTDKYGFWKNKPKKVDWEKVKAMGPRFWFEMEWMPDAQDAFNTILDWEKQGLFEVFILSSIDFEDGVEGKTQWIKAHTNLPMEKVIFVTEPEDKAQYANKDSWLVDDREKSLIPFALSGGNVIKFEGDWTLVCKTLYSMFSAKR